MEPGETGSIGLSAPRHVDQGQEAESENVTTQHQLTGAGIVKDQVLSQESVTQMLAQVKPKKPNSPWTCVYQFKK